MITYNNDHPVSKIEVGLAGLTEEQIDLARTEAAYQKISLRESLLKLVFIDEPKLLAAVAERTGLQFLDVSSSSISEKALDTVPAKVATHYNVVPVEITDGILTVATADPFEPHLRREIELVLGNSYNVKFVLATSEAIRKTIRKYYGIGAATVEQMVTAERIEESTSYKKDLLDENKNDDASVIKLVNQLLVDAISVDATDIHIEPYESELKVRYRVDGMLHEAGIPKTVRIFREGIVSRIKIMSGLDISEKRLPQDGAAQVSVSNHKFDLRISVLPARYGEAINIRILPQSRLIVDLSSLGMADDVVDKLNTLITKPHGIILVTGPTGSGKTTTLYACMNVLKDTDRKIITIEDPVEYDMHGIVQMQVHSDIGFTFARALRSMLRHDPDIMLVGEIRDFETAETAIRSALTGHLVFSTLHTNDAASAITRLLDMGIEPFLVASSVDAILAQRLVRLICPHCREPYNPSPEIATAIKSLMQLDKLPVNYHGRGCTACRFTGYKGRTAIAELLLLSENIREMASTKKYSNEIDAQARKEGMTSLFLSGVDKVYNGITTFEEVLRVTKGTTLGE